MTPWAANDIESVLVYGGFDRVGDGLLKLPFVRGLKRAFPAAPIAWVAGQETSVYASVLAEAVSGLIDEIVENAGIGIMPRKLIGGRPGGALAGRRFDLVIDTQRIFWCSLSLKRVPHDRRVDHRPGRGLRQPRDGRDPRGRGRGRVGEGAERRLSRFYAVAGSVSSAAG